jgi:transcriptional regulator with XRE-family HTH domain
MGGVSVSHDKDQSLQRLGAVVRARRLALELSQEALADVAGVDRSHMGKMERGERNVTFLNILRIAQALTCKPSELLGEAGL